MGIKRSVSDTERERGRERNTETRACTPLFFIFAFSLGFFDPALIFFAS